MSGTPLLVVGAGGLLGRQVLARAAAHGLDAVGAGGLPWSDPDAVRVALRAPLEALLERAGTRPWALAWCAGAGVVASGVESLEAEREVVAGVVADLAQRAGRDARGVVFLASSAGAVYAGSTDPPFDERTEPCPLVPYGHLKLRMEQSVVGLLEDRPGIRLLVGRIANLYGPGQRLDKQQGLVSMLCQAHITGQPLPVYVPMETTRDYLFVTDAADMALAGVAALARDATCTNQATRAPAAAAVTKILASGRGTSIAELAGLAGRLHRRRTPMTVGSSPRGQGQVIDLRLRSQTWPELDGWARTPLIVGMAATREDLRRRHAAGAWH